MPSDYKVHTASWARCTKATIPWEALERLKSGLGIKDDNNAADLSKCLGLLVGKMNRHKFSLRAEVR